MCLRGGRVVTPGGARAPEPIQQVEHDGASQSCLLSRLRRARVQRLGFTRRVLGQRLVAGIAEEPGGVVQPAGEQRVLPEHACLVPELEVDRPPVQQAPPSDAERLVHRPPDQVVRESKGSRPTRNLDQQLTRGEVLDRPQASFLGHFGQRRCGPWRKAVAEDGRGFDQTSHLGPEPIDAAAHGAADALRDCRQLRRLGHGPGGLEGVERHPVTLLGHAGNDVRGQPAAQQQTHVLARQRLEVDQAGLGQAAQGFDVWTRLAGANGHGPQHGGQRQATRAEQQRIDARRIGPVQVVDGDQDWPCSGEDAQQVQRAFEHPASADLRQRSLARVAQHHPQLRHDLAQCVGVGTRGVDQLVRAGHQRAHRFGE